MSPEAIAYQEPPSPLIETKLVPPRARTGMLERPRLKKRLDALAGSAVILIDAPVGFGKTVLAQSWCANRTDAATVWVSLDAADNDAVRLWTHIATALDRVDREIGGRALARLRAPEAPVETAVDDLVNGLAVYGREIDIVLDDMHVLTDTAGLRPLEHLIDRLPPNVRLLVLTRSDPPIRLGRLRASRLLGEIRQRDLAFTVDEARDLLVAREGVPLVDADLELLVERTEGWPAGLYLAGLWLREFDDPGSAVRGFSGDQRPVAEYLAAEVLDGLDARQRTFLVRSSVFGRFNAELCDVALEREDSAEMLERIVRENGFVVSLDARAEWYRYHHLFRDLLALELRRVDPSSVEGLHRRASEWFAERQLVDEAIDHAAATGDTDAVVQILREHHAVFTRSSRSATLVTWVDRLPDDVILDAPELAGVAALASCMLSRPVAERQRFLALAERTRSERPAAWSPYAAAALGLARGVWIEDDVGATIAAGRAAVESAPGAGGAADVPAHACLALALYLGDDIDGAEIAATRAVEHPTSPGRPGGLLVALATLALVELERGRTFNAQTHADRAVAVGEASGMIEISIAAIAITALAAVHAAQGRWAEAEREAERAEVLRRAPDRNVPHAHAQLVLAEIRMHRGRLAWAATDLERARQEIDGFPDAGRLPAMVEGLQRSLDAALAESAPIELAEPPSDAELPVLRLLATPLSQREIGDSLFLSVNTVKSHTRELYRKLGVGSRDDAVARAVALELIDDAAPATQNARILGT